MLYVRAVEVCQDVDKAPPVLIIGDTPAVVAFAGKIGKSSVWHRVFWSKVVEENPELVHRDA